MAVVAIRASDLITGSLDGTILVLKATSARSRYRACMESVLRLSQAICPRLRVEFGLIHIPATSVLGFLRILCNEPRGLFTRYRHKRQYAGQDCTARGRRKLPTAQYLQLLPPPAFRWCSKRDSFAGRKRLCLIMAVFKMKKCPTCIGIGACDEGDKCPTCEGTGEVPTDQVIIDDPCQPAVCLEDRQK
jgi:hypothetical protein